MKMAVPMAFDAVGAVLVVDKGNMSREFLYQCLVRDVIKKRIADRDKAFEFLGRWEIHHKNSKLRDDVLISMAKGQPRKGG
jgi:hypothetical protein